MIATRSSGCAEGATMPYDLIEKQVIFEGRKIRLEVHHFRDELSGGRVAREVVMHPGAVVVLPILPDGRLLLIQNKRFAVNETLIELPAGTLEKNENPMNCAGRELLEETGYLAGKITLIGTFYTSPGILSEKMFAYLAYDLEQKEAALEAGEEIELLPVAMDQAIAMIGSGQITDGKTIATLLMYERYHRSA
jgi:ADP-ribose pyrophosphatase